MCIMEVTVDSAVDRRKHGDTNASTLRQGPDMLITVLRQRNGGVLMDSVACTDPHHLSRLVSWMLR